MNIQIKQRIAGIIVVMVILAVIVPLLLTGSKHSQHVALVNTVIPKDIPQHQGDVPSHKLYKYWVVQLASFSNKTHADDLVSKLQTDGFNGYVESAIVANSPVFRALVGPEHNKKRAEVLVKKLYQTFHMKGIVVKNEV